MNSFTKEMWQDLYRLMLCLGSSEREDVLYEQIEDGELGEDGITEEMAMAGISWWDDNETLVKEFAHLFIVSLKRTAIENNLRIGDLLDWELRSWKDFISESFGCNWGNEENFEYFFDYAIKQSLGFNTGSQEGEDSQGARGIEISPAEWITMTKLFECWWKRKDVFEIFTQVHEKTIEGRKLVNSGTSLA
jgi:hypothetical protein